MKNQVAAGRIAATMTRKAKHQLSAAFLLLSMGASTAALATPFTFTPDLSRNTAQLEALVPVRQFMNVSLPKGSIEFDDGLLSVNIVPNWNFDRVAVLQGPIIRTEVNTNGRDAIVTGVVLFIQGYWYDKYWTVGSKETIVTNNGTTLLGKITDLTATTLTITGNDGTATVVPMADIKELHSPRAYVFAVPAHGPNPLNTDSAWTADVQTVTLASTVAPTAAVPTANIRRDPLLVTKDATDWSPAKMMIIGTALSIVNTAQFVPEVVLPQFSHQLWQHNNKKAFYSLTHPLPPNPAPLLDGGNTWSIPIPFNQTH